MANYTVANGMASSGRFTLVADEITVVTFTENIGKARVISDGVAAVYATFDGTESSVDGPNTYELPAGMAYAREELTTNTPAGDIVSLISSGTPSVRVERVDG